MIKRIFSVFLFIFIICFCGCDKINIMDSQDETEEASIPLVTKISDMKYEIVDELSQESFLINKEEYKHIKNCIRMWNKSSSRSYFQIEILDCDMEICRYEKDTYYTSLVYSENKYINIYFYIREYMDDKEKIHIGNFVEADVPYGKEEWDKYFGK